MQATATLYRKSCRHNGDALFSNSSSYVDRQVPLAAMLELGFFPKREGTLLVDKDEMLFLFGSDGWTIVQCTGHDVEGNALLEQAQSTLLKISTRKAA